ncbi:MAG: glycosyltransferase, partial [Bacilli bacterium]|nr:glycosyltransferase [Bacilli bacterium]
MRVIITAGGTGGHIYPALAILDKIKEMEPDSEFLYIGTHNRMEKDIVPNRGIK